jgi:hypothetical protein
MRRSVALLAVLTVPVHAAHGIAAVPRAHISNAQQLASRMARALSGQRRIEVTGVTNGPGTLKTRYLLRYQAKGRELLAQRGGPWTAVHLPGQTVDGIEQIVIGKLSYSSMDGHHWYRSAHAAVPEPIDAVSLNIANAPCCVPDAVTDSMRIVDLGDSWWNGQKVHQLSFSLVAAGYAVDGTVLIDAKTYLPLRYTQHSDMPETRGSFSIHYGGTFLITAP